MAASLHPQPGNRNKPPFSHLSAGIITSALSPSQFIRCLNGMIQEIVGPPMTGRGFPYAGGVTKAGRYVSGRLEALQGWLPESRIKDTSTSRGEIGADEREDLEELLTHYPQKNHMKAQTQTRISHPRCFLVFLISNYKGLSSEDRTGHNPGNHLPSSLSLLESPK